MNLSIIIILFNYINISKYIGIIDFFNKMLEINHKDYKHFFIDIYLVLWYHKLVQKIVQIKVQKGVNMITVGTSNFRSNIKEYLEKATEENTDIIITRKNNQASAVLISLEKYNELTKGVDSKDKK